MTPIKLAILISGEGSNLQAIIDAIANGLPATITAVISSHDKAYGLTRAEKAKIPTYVLPKHYDDSLLLSYLHQAQPDLIVLAGFMKILTPAVIHAFNDCIINVHPSLLPQYKGLDTHKRVLAAGDPEHGTTFHWVTAELDAGPIIFQRRFAITEDDDENSLKQKVKDIEHTYYPKIIEAFASKNLFFGEKLEKNVK